MKIHLDFKSFWQQKQWERFSINLWQTLRQKRCEKQQLGFIAEKQAADFLLLQGLKIVGKNIRSGKGEIDLICLENSLPVFIEVRFRGKGAWVSAGASINAAKQKIFLQTAKQIMLERGWIQARFDAVLLNEGCPIEWIKNAFPRVLHTSNYRRGY